MIKLRRKICRRALAACLAVLCCAASCATASAQSAPRFGESAAAGPSTIQIATPPAASASGTGPLLSYQRDEEDDNPLRPPTGASPPIDNFAPGAPHDVVPAAATTPSTSADRALQVGASAAFDAANPAAETVPAAPVAAPVEDYGAIPIVTYTADEDGRAAPVDASAAAPVPAAPFESNVVPLQAAAPPPAALASATFENPESRRLAPPSLPTAGGLPGGGRPGIRTTLLPTAFTQLKSLSSAGAALVAVVGLFVGCALLLRRGSPKPTGVLPAEAFAVLGRAPLTAQSFAQLLRVGNKLVLVAVTADGAQPLAEVNDPAEVDRIAGLCLSGRGDGPSAEFQQVLAQLSREPAKGFLGREGSSARRRG